MSDACIFTVYPQRLDNGARAITQILQMRQPSIFVKALIIVAGSFFVLAFVLMRIPEAALAAFIFFFFLWAALQSVGRDPNLSDARSRRYFRFIALIGVLMVAISGYGFVVNVLDAKYNDALHSLGPALLFWGIAWKYRKQWRSWLRE